MSESSPAEDAAPPLQPPVAGKIAAVVVLLLMASSMGWLGWTIITYWNRVGV